MRLVRFGETGREKPGIMAADGSLRDLSGQIGDIDPNWIASGGIEKLAGLDMASLPRVPDGVRIGPCIGNIGKMVCIGLNYSDHAAETNNPVPAEPIMFMKATNAICGPNDNVEMPRGSTKLDWEVELGIIIGGHTKYVSEADAMGSVAGYCIVNDVSERHFQIERLGQWTKGKSHDTFGPTGPWFVTKDEIPDPHNLAMGLDVDGKVMQNGSTRTMIFGVEKIVSYVSQFMSLQPGDVISTGTPPGVGMGMKPEPVFLSVGQEMRVWIEGLGEQRQTVVQA